MNSSKAMPTLEVNSSELCLGFTTALFRAGERKDAFLNEQAIYPMVDQTSAVEDARKPFEHLARGAFGCVVVNGWPLGAIETGSALVKANCYRDLD